MNRAIAQEPRQTMAIPDVLYGPIQPELLHEEILADLLEATARRTPDQIALIAGEHQLSYRELDAQAGPVGSSCW